MGDKLIVLVIVDVLDFMNARREKNATADDTRIVRNIGRAPQRRYPALRAIRYRILFGVHRRLFMSIPYHGYMLTSRKEPIISLAYNPIRVNKDASHVEAFTGASFGRYLHDFLKIFVP
jgi:hypothetical protein